MTSEEIVNRVKKLRAARNPTPVVTPKIKDSPAANIIGFGLLVLGGVSGIIYMAIISANERPAALISLFLFFALPMFFGLGMTAKMIFWSNDALPPDAGWTQKLKRNVITALTAYGFFVALILGIGMIFVVLRLLITAH